VFVAGVLVGADSMSRGVAVPTYVADVIVAVALIAMLVATLFARYRLVFRAKAPQPSPRVRAEREPGAGAARDGS
jgi:simple sugar transport system permease protein